MGKTNVSKVKFSAAVVKEHTHTHTLEIMETSFPLSNKLQLRNIECNKPYKRHTLFFITFHFSAFHRYYMLQMEGKTLH